MRITNLSESTCLGARFESLRCAPFLLAGLQLLTLATTISHVAREARDKYHKFVRGLVFSLPVQCASGGDYYDADPVPRMRGLLHAALLRLSPGGVLRPRAPEAPLGRRTPKGVPTVPPGNQQGQGQVKPVLLQIIETVVGCLNVNSITPPTFEWKVVHSMTALTRMFLYL